MLPLWDFPSGIPSTSGHRAIDEAHDLRGKSSLGFGFDTLQEFSPVFYSEYNCGNFVHGQSVPVGHSSWRFAQFIT